MKMKHPTLPGRFYIVNNVFYYDATTKFGRIRKSTGCKTLDEAVAWVSTSSNRESRAFPPMKFELSFATRIVHQAKWNAKARKIPFAITRDDLEDMYRRAKGYCEVSGLPFDLRQMDGVKRRPYIPSIDRIDQSKGYTKDNCRIVCAAVNLAMNEWGEEVLWNVASSMVEHRTLRHNLAIRGKLQKSDNSLILE